MTVIFADLAGRGGVATGITGVERAEVTNNGSGAGGSAQRNALEGLRDTILHIGRQRFGRAPSRKQKADLDAITDAERLERIRDRLLTASSWADLLATP